MKIQFESSTACNSNCKCCPRSIMTRKHGEMSDEMFHKIIKEGREIGVRSFYPFLNGEPFVFPRIWEWLDYMQKQKVKVALYTNAEFLDADRLAKYTNIKYVNCSFNGATKETYDKVMRRPDYEKAKKNIERLIRVASFRVRVSMVQTEDNIHETEDFKKMWGRRGKITQYMNWAGANHSSIEKTGEKRHCYHLAHSLTILWDGRVCLCCLDYDGKVILGDLNKESLKDIMPRIELLRTRHRALDFDMPLCKTCNANLIKKK